MLGSELLCGNTRSLASLPFKNVARKCCLQAKDVLTPPHPTLLQLHREDSAPSFGRSAFLFVA